MGVSKIGPVRASDAIFPLASFHRTPSFGNEIRAAASIKTSKSNPSVIFFPTVRSTRVYHGSVTFADSESTPRLLLVALLEFTRLLLVVLLEFTNRACDQVKTSDRLMLAEDAFEMGQKLVPDVSTT